MVTLNLGDLDFILDQILLSEELAAGVPLTQAGGGILALDPTLPFGLRTVSGADNNLLAGQDQFGAADNSFPELVDDAPLNDADGDTFDPDGPLRFDPVTGAPIGGFAPPITNTDYGVPGDVADADPRIISNLVVDQTLSNPAAIAAALQYAGVEDAAAALTEIRAAFVAFNATLTPETRAAAMELLAAQVAAGNAPDVLAALSAASAVSATAVSEIDQTVTAISAINTLFATDANLGINNDERAAIAAAVLEAQQAQSAAIALRDALLTGPASALASAEALVLNTTSVVSQLQSINTAAQQVAGVNPLESSVQAALDEALTLATQNQTDAASLVGAIGTSTTTTELAATLTEHGIEIESNGSIIIPNVAPDEGLSAPFNGWFVLFGQFFDHGLDLVAKGDYGTVYVPLQPDDPLYNPDSPQTNFMVLTRATRDPVTGEPINNTSPFVDQNQTYTSHASHQVFVRDYETGADGAPQATGKLIEGATGGMATWKDVKEQAATKLGILLTNEDVVRVPLLATDDYGNFLEGPNGFPQIVIRADFATAFPGVDISALVTGVTADGRQLVEGNPAAPVPAAWAEATGHAFLDDIAHNAAPGTVFDTDGDPLTPGTSVVAPDDDNIAGNLIQVDYRGRKVAYDDELLDEHFIAGDGRVNENFGLTAVHHIFHSEHNRLVEQIQNTIFGSGDLAFINQWLDVPLTALPADATGLDWNGERIFQAAKFATEMQYQHLVFEEFARKVQPQVNIFAGYDITIDPSIVAEFAHAVYRFGHSQLRENVDVVDSQGNLTEVGLIDAFLNPLGFDGANTINADIAAGAIVRGMTRQTGSAIDEFVTDALRNNLLGLPLDLATLNIARARETGVATLNEFRREMYALTSDPKLKPYDSWVDFAAHAKHELSVVNFIAAYGTHESITGLVDDGAGGLREKTLEEKRDAALLLVIGGTGAPGDRLEFLNSTGAWANQETGLNLVDLWIGGLAEAIEPFGGMLGSTFNFIFEVQLENLQDGDRFYYLTRVAGLNFLTELESNSFAALIQRNTDLGYDESDPNAFITHLPGDIFANPGLILEAHVALQQDYDPDVGAERTLDLGRDPQGASLFNQTVLRIDADGDGNAEYLRYIGGEHVVLGGTNLNDHLVGSIGDDTLWGDGGDDYLEGGDGADILNGGTGDDILVDIGGAGDNLKGGDGNDVIVAGGQEALILAGRGKDYVLAGQDLKETFGGEGDDFINAGDGSNIVFGGEGDDWIEGGAQADLLQGDNGAPFQDSPIIGNDVIIGGGGNDDYDAESGDDILVADPGITRHEGMLGYDWVTHKGDSQPGTSDLTRVGALIPAVDNNLDRFDQVEGLSGWIFDDVLRGDDRTGADLAAGADAAIGEGGLGGHELTNFDLIRGLRNDGTNPAALFSALTTVFNGGNIILGGGGSDVIEGRGGDDVIDGDHWLNVRIEIRDSNGVVLGSVDRMQGLLGVENTTAAGASLIGKTVNELMLTRELNPGNLFIVREILNGGGSDDVDIAQYSGVRAEYTISGPDELGFRTVSHLGGAATDGVDRVRNIEALLFADGIVILDPNVQNGPAVGSLSITDSTPATPAAVGDTFTAGIGNVQDPDGAPDFSEFTVTWQFEQTPGANDWIAIVNPLTGATVTGPTFTPVAGMELEGFRIRASATFVGNNGIPEFVVSPPTAALAASAVTAATEGPDLLFGTVGDDVIDGLGGDDEIFGFAGNDTLIGGLGDDLLDGGPGRDTLVGGPGSDIMDGGAGANDTAVFDGNLADFTITFTPEGVIEVLNATGTIEDAVINIEFLEFDDQTITIAEAEALAGVIRLDTLGVTTFTGTAADEFIIGAPGNVAETINGAGGDDLIQGNGGADVLNGNGGRDTLNGGNGADVLNGGADDDALFGDNGSDTISGGAGDDVIQGGAGNDTIAGNAGEDLIIWNTGDGRDLVDGGGPNANNGADTFEIIGDVAAETWRIYAATDPTVTLPGALNGLNTEIVITRDDGSGEQIIAELDNIEELVINAAAVDATVVGPTPNGGDTVQVIGNFAGTSLALNTITVNGNSGNDTIDISGLLSAHRIVFRSNGGNDTLLGALRPQDVIELAPGTTVADYTSTTTGGVTTLSNGTNSVSFTAGLTPTIRDGQSTIVSGGTARGAVAFTASDIVELKKLVHGIPSDKSDEPGATGIRDLEGTGNNLINVNFGAVDQPFIRLTEARYGGYDEATGNMKINPIFEGLDPRNISNLIGAQEANLSGNEAEANILFMAFGQYFDHGLDFLPKTSANGTIEIGGPGSGGALGSDNPADLTRGAVNNSDAVANGATPEHLNKTSPFVDQNQAYGSNELVGQFLRESDGNRGLGARLLQGDADPSNPAFALLPTLREAILHHWNGDTIFQTPDGPVSFRQYYTAVENGVVTPLVSSNGAINEIIAFGLNENFMGSGFTLVGDRNNFINILDHYIAGDLRANENYTLTSIHTIWARNHNYYVAKLEEAGFGGTDEELFQAAKIVNEAEYQKVVFGEFADYLLGGLKGSGHHGHDEYNPAVDARISHEFAAAVYRVGHSLIGQNITILDDDGNPVSVPLFDAFLNPTNDIDSFGGAQNVAALAQFGYVPKPGFEQIGVDSILGGIVQQEAEEVDFNIVDAVRNDLVRIRADLFAFNVARGWDVGLGTLNQIRADLLASSDPYIREAIELSGEDLTPYASWEDFQQRNSLSNTVLQQFRDAYPDLVLDPSDVAEFQQVNPNIQIGPNNTVRGIDRVDLWVGGLAEKHINGGMVGTTFWVVLHEQFDRLQEGDRFYYLDRVDGFDFYETIDEMTFADVVARNSGLSNLDNDIFRARPVDVSENGNGNGNDDSDDETTGDGDQSGDGGSNGGGDSTSGTDTGTGNGTGTGTDTNTGTTPATPVVHAGDSSNNALVGGIGSDVFIGGDGDDTLMGIGGDDSYAGGDGADNIVAGNGKDVIFGNAGDDIILAGGGNDVVYGGSGRDQISGDAGDDLIDGGTDRDVVNAGDGNDTVFAAVGDGNDVYHGGDGIDTLNMEAIEADISVDLGTAGFASSSESGFDSLSGFENFRGGAGDDTITASDASGVVHVLEGGAGQDTYVFRTIEAANGDRIEGFQAGDQIDLSAIASSFNLTQGFALVSGGQFNAAGQIMFTVQGSDTIVTGNVNDNDLDADFSIVVAGRTDLTREDVV